MQSQFSYPNILHLIDDFLEESEIDTLRMQQRAIRAFTESIEMDFPPAPELPQSLDIDHYGFGMKESSTADTIIDASFLL